MPIKRKYLTKECYTRCPDCDTWNTSTHPEWTRCSCGLPLVILDPPVKRRFQVKVFVPGPVDESKTYTVGF